MDLVTTWHLEMTEPGQLRPAAGPDLIVRCAAPSAAVNRFFYAAVGADWTWTDRLGWSEERWHQHVVRPEVETWVGYVEDTPAGYFELEAQAEGNVEILYFGLLPQFVGRGLGGRLLTHAVERAWARPGATRVWVHTCNLDHPAALRNYEARGFRLFKTEQARREVPRPGTPGP